MQTCSYSFIVSQPRQTWRLDSGYFLWFDEVPPEMQETSCSCFNILVLMCVCCASNCPEGCLIFPLVAVILWVFEQADLPLKLQHRNTRWNLLKLSSVARFPLQPCLSCFQIVFVGFFFCEDMTVKKLLSASVRSPESDTSSFFSTNTNWNWNIGWNCVI